MCLKDVLTALYKNIQITSLQLVAYCCSLGAETCKPPVQLYKARIQWTKKVIGHIKET